MELQPCQRGFVLTKWNGPEMAVVIPSSANDRPICRIGFSCFARSDVDSVVVHAKIELVESESFAYSRLSQIQFQDVSSLKTIEFRAFCGCRSLRQFFLASRRGDHSLSLL